MTSSHLYLWLALLVLSVLLTAGMASAAVQDNFNRPNNSTGTFNLGTATNGNVWTHYETTAGDWDITGQQLFYDQNSGSANDAAELEISANPDRIDYQLQMSGFNGFYYASLSDSTNDWAGTPAIQYRVDTLPAGELQLRHTSAWNPIINLSTNTLYELSFRNINYVAETYDFYLDNVSLATSVPFSNTGSIQYFEAVPRQNFDTLFIDCIVTDDSLCVSNTTVTNASVMASDTYTGSSIINFTVSWNGTNYTTTNGTIVLPFNTNQTAINQTWNLTYYSNESGGYFSRSYTDINLSSSHTGSLHQAEITFNATNRVSGAAVVLFTVNTTANGGSATDTDTNPQLQLSAADGYVVDFAKNNYYPASVTFNVSALEQSTKTFSGLYNHKLNVSITSGGSATDQNFSANVYSLDYVFSEQASTTQGAIVFNLTPGNYSVWINDSLHSLENANITLNSSSNFTNLVIDVRTTNTFNITIFNETTNLLLDNVNITWAIISTDEVRNGTTGNGTIIEELLTPGSYEIQYYREPTVRRSYFVTLSNQSSEDIRLYLIDDDESNLYLPVVTDEDDQACPDMTVSLLRYYLDINGYRTVEMAKTDTNGQGLLHVQPNEINYKLLFTGSCGTFTTQPQKIVASTDGFTVTQAQGLLTSATALQSAVVNVSYNNVTQTYVFSWSDTDNIVTQGCLYVFRTAGGVKATNYSQCSNGASGSLIYTLSGNLTDTLWTAQGVLSTSSTFSTYTYRGPDLDFRTSLDNWGVVGVFWGIILLLGVVMMSANTAGALVFSTVGTIAVLITLGLVAGSGAALIGLLIIGVITLFKIKTS